MVVFTQKKPPQTDVTTKSNPLQNSDPGSNFYRENSTRVIILWQVGFFSTEENHSRRVGLRLPTGWKLTLIIDYLEIKEIRGQLCMFGEGCAPRKQIIDMQSLSFYPTF